PPAVILTPGQGLVWGQQWNPSAQVGDPSPIDAQSLRCEWAFGDGQGAEVTNCTNSNVGVAHTYPPPGHYSAALTVFDKDGGVTSQSAVNAVSRRPSSFTGFQAVVQTQGQTSSVAFQATLIDGYAKTPLAGRTVQLSIGTGSASATTDATGNFQGTLPYTPGLAAAIASVS